LIDSVTDYIYSVKIENGVVINTNHGKGCEQVTGYSKNEFEQDESLWFNSIYTEDKEIVNKHLNQIFANEKPAPFEHRIIHKNGTVKWVKDTIVLHYDSNNSLIGYDGLISDITNNKLMEQQILNLIIETEEKERLYFSQELHDGVGPLLSASKLYLEWLVKTNDPSKREEIQQDLENLLYESSKVIREISFKLSPHVLTHFGVVYAINSFIEKVKFTSNIEYTFISNLEKRIGSKMEILLYRIAAELINNTIKYANAKKVSLSINNDENKIEMIYSDDGIGFDVIKISKVTEGVGLFNMHNRINTFGGSLTIKSTETEGTKVHVVLPLHT
jgi:PAS domain S-box-containing protein